MVFDLTKLTLASARQLLDERQVSAVELTEAILSRIAETDKELNAFITVSSDLARRQAVAAQSALDRGEGGLLAGIPIAHKDMFCTRGVETTAASNILRGYIPPYSATVVERLEKAGAVTVGKLNCDAFAHGASTENSDFGVTRNPYDLSRVSGGSSGGSAAALAAGQALGSTGTDTGGSIRQPASFCNVVGVKPTYGRVSRYGVIAMASSTDCPGPFAKSVEDAAILLGVIAGHDPLDATSSKRPVPDYRAGLRRDINGLRIGVPKEFFGSGLDPEVAELIRAAIAEFESQGARIEEVSMPILEHALAAYYIIVPAEVSSNLARFDGIKYGFSIERDRSAKPSSLLEVYERSRGAGFGAEAKRRIMLGAYALSAGYVDAYYKKAHAVRALIRRAFEEIFLRCDLLMGPVSPTPAFRIGERSGDPMAMYLSDIYTTSLNLAGVPGISVPAGFAGGLPVGLQIVAPHFGEELMLSAAYQYEQATGFYKNSPEFVKS